MNVGDGAGHVGQKPLTVAGEQGELDGIEAVLGPHPLDLNSPVGVVKQILNVRAAFGMHRNSFPAGDVAGDFLPPNGITTLSAVDHQVTVAVHLDGHIAGDTERPFHRGKPGRVGRLDLS